MTKTVIITGASAGIGAAAARKFAKLDVNLAVIGRSRQKTEAVASETGAKPYIVDFSSLDDIRRLGDELHAEYPVVDVLAHNAGLIAKTLTLSKDGYELTFQVNYLAPFLLTALLRDRLEASADARVVSTASAAHMYGRIDLDRLTQAPERYSAMRVYGTWKLANILFTQELASRAKATSVTASSFHPGPVASDFFRNNRVLRALVGSPIGKLALVTPDKGADPLLHLATVPDAQSVNGAYFDKMRRSRPRNAQAKDPEFTRLLWDRTADLLGVGDQADSKRPEDRG
ncbi:NAD(P)-dependent dehydrogenase (short-subunit alcohol dehydrogenase family) [Kibdelosporangium banguiense]|uniref:NAD(P)-dependent dehydrogenase (Short-subunit alcohol dehydrogenase family) n=1 Tax=Kibdelosporangium banguiense TaxID=1365924 RepID=A0ABS4TKL6_9PSEU|nr:SDR family NAD(P)-dependent oxidoreductase [Kibdelosporangium banguiense]MBP2324386.1 NAD(P)-dependent dehydrogenase (short-subunit alcohol dehydrogenase family) [Kibdelosporangium banguiense]